MRDVDKFSLSDRLTVFQATCAPILWKTRAFGSTFLVFVHENLQLVRRRIFTCTNTSRFMYYDCTVATHTRSQNSLQYFCIRIQEDGSLETVISLPLLHSCINTFPGQNKSSLFPLYVLVNVGFWICKLGKVIAEGTWILFYALDWVCQEFKFTDALKTIGHGWEKIVVCLSFFICIQVCFLLLQLEDSVI